MKKLRVLTAVVVAVAVGAGIFYACQKGIDELLIDDTVNSKTQKISHNLFDILIKKEEPSISINEFSSILLDLQVEKIDIVEIDNKRQFLAFKVEGLTSIFVNAVSIDFSSRIYKIAKEGNFYTLTDNQTDFAVSYNIENKESYIINKDEKINFNSLTDDMIRNNSNILNYPVYISLLGDFIGDMPKEKPSFLPNPPSRRLCRVDRGTGIGFHLSRSDAKFFGKQDMNKILDANPGWYSSGMSVSCIWDNHFCIVTARFFEDVPC